MKREEQELLERAEVNESREEKPEIEVNQQDDGLEDEFDREFWIKVSNFYEFFVNFLRIWIASRDCLILIWGKLLLDHLIKKYIVIR